MPNQPDAVNPAIAPRFHLERQRRGVTNPHRWAAAHAITMKQYDVVRVAAIRSDRFASQRPQFQRHPHVGDVGTILEVYGDAFEVECCERSTGVTVWLEAMFPDELQSV